MITDIHQNSRIILIALCGKSPAVITETVWALAHETLPVLPDRVVVFTTGAGRAELIEQLIDSGVWERLRSVLGCDKDKLIFGNTGDSIRVFPSLDGQVELDDITSPQDNQSVADFMLENFRQFTENPAQQLIVSIAGGRKTMSLLCGFTLSMLGRIHDRLCHVLVSPEFESANLTPRFYFPDPGIGAYRFGASGPAMSGDRAKIQLADIPFVPLRYLFERDFSKSGWSYMELVHSVNAQIEREVDHPSLDIRLADKSCRINDVDVPLNPPEFITYYFLALRCLNGDPPVVELKDLYSRVLAYLDELDDVEFPYLDQCRDMIRRRDPMDMRKVTSSIKAKIRSATNVRLAESCAPADPNNPGQYRLRLPPENIRVL